MRYWLRVKKDSLGPFTPEEIRQHPDVTEGTLVYPETAKSGADWKRMRDVPELLRAIKSTQSAPPPVPKAPLSSPRPHAVATPPQSTLPHDQSLLAIIALVLTLLSIPFEVFVVREVMTKMAIELAGGEWMVYSIMMLIPAAFVVVMSIVGRSNAMNSVSRSGSGAATTALVIGFVQIAILGLFSLFLFTVAKGTSS